MHLFANENGETLISNNHTRTTTATKSENL